MEINFISSFAFSKKSLGFCDVSTNSGQLREENEAKYAFAYMKIPQVALGIFALNSCIAKGAVAFVILIKN